MAIRLPLGTRATLLVVESVRKTMPFLHFANRIGHIGLMVAVESVTSFSPCAADFGFIPVPIGGLRIEPALIPPALERLQMFRPADFRDGACKSIHHQCFGIRID